MMRQRTPPLRWPGLALACGGLLAAIFFPTAARAGLAQVGVLQDPGLESPVGAVLSPDGRQLYVRSGSNIVILGRDPASGELSLEPFTGAPGQVSTAAPVNVAGLALSPDGLHAYTMLGTQTSVYGRDPATGALTLLSRHDYPGAGSLASGCFTLQFSNDGLFGYCHTSYTINVYVRDPTTGLLTYSSQAREGVDGGLGTAGQVLLSPDQAFVYASDAAGRKLSVFARDVGSGALTQLETLTLPVAPNLSPKSIVLSGDGKHLYASANGYTNTLDTNVVSYSVDAISGTLSHLATYTAADFGALPYVVNLLPSSDGSSLYVAHYGGLMQLHRDAASGALTAVETLSDTNLQATASTVVLVAPPETDQLYFLSRNHDMVVALQRAAGSGLLAVTDTEVGGTDLPFAELWQHAFFLAGDRLVTLSSDHGTDWLCVLDREVDSFALLNPLCIDPQAASSTLATSSSSRIATSPDGRTVAVSEYMNGEVATFRLDPAAPALNFVQATLVGPGRVNALAFSDDGRQLYVGATNEMRAFTVDPATGQFTALASYVDGVAGFSGIANASTLALAHNGLELLVRGPGGWVRLQRNPADGTVQPLSPLTVDRAGNALSFPLSYALTKDLGGQHLALYSVNDDAIVTLRWGNGGWLHQDTLSLALPVRDPRAAALSDDGTLLMFVADSTTAGVPSLLQSKRRMSADGPVTSGGSLVNGLSEVDIALAPTTRYGYSRASNGLVIYHDVPPPPPPVAVDDAVIVFQGHDLSLNVLANDSFDPAALSLVDYSGIYGAMPPGTSLNVVEDLAQGVLRFELQHPVGYGGDYRFDYRLYNADGASSLATVTIYVWSSPPVDNSLDVVTTVTDEPGGGPAGDPDQVGRPGSSADGADTACALPSVEVCQEADYLLSSCGQDALYQVMCRDLLAAEAQALTADLAVETVVSADGNGTVEARVVPYSNNDHRVTGMEGLYNGRVLKNRIAAGSDRTTSRNLLDARHRDWQDNCAIYSCDEYVYEKYFDYENFELAMAALGDDPRAVFELAYDGSLDVAPIANQTLRQLDGTPSTQIQFSVLEQARNAYFTFDPQPRVLDAAALYETLTRPLPDGSDDGLQFPFGLPIFNWNVQVDSAGQPLLDRLAGAPGYIHGWAFHENASTALASGGYSDDLLLTLDDAQDQFRTRMALRQRVLDEVYGSLLVIAYNYNELVQSDALDEHRRRIAGMSGGPAQGPGFDLLASQDTVTEVRAQRVRLMQALEDLAQVEASLRDDLLSAEAQGCLETSGFTPCDWSPRMLVEELSDHFTSEREADFQTCLLRTGDDFNRAADSGWLLEQEEQLHFCADGTRCTVRASHIRSVTTLEEYFAALQAWVEALALPRDPETGLPMVAQSGSDSGGESAGMFGIEYDFDFGWRATDFVDDLCSTRISAVGNLDVHTKAFGTSTRSLGVPLFGADLSLSSYQSGPLAARIDAALALEVLGIDLAVPTLQGEASINIIDGPVETIEPVPAQSVTILVAGIPLVIRGGVNGSVGANIDLQADADACSSTDQGLRLGIVGRFEPFARADAYASVALDVVLAEAGIRTDLNLVTLSLPFTTDLLVELGSDEARLVVGSDLDATLGLLDGRVSAYVEILGEDYVRRIFGWSGPSWTANLMHFGYTYPLDPLAAALRTSVALPADPPLQVNPRMCTDTCYDGVQNAGETGVDCGGTCRRDCPICEQGNELLVNGDFEQGGGAAGAANLLPQGWQAVGAPAPDLFSTTGDVGLLPSGADFYRASAYSGARFVGASGDGNESFAQQLATPLASDQSYGMVGAIRQPTASGRNAPGGFALWLSTSKSLSGAQWLGTVDATINPSDAHPWERRTLFFTAPTGAETMPWLLIAPIGAYVGIDGL
ncbi:MAG: beta-propeller fold lactonase family protein, partial [Pseudomonadota bacterium]